MRARAVLLAAGVALACAGCGPRPAAGGEAASDGALRIRVEGPSEPVATGEGFPLVVVRAWPHDVVPAVWDDRALAPLVVRETTTTRRETGGGIEETRRVRAHAMSLADVVVPPLRFAGKPRDGGATRLASAASLLVRVRPSLDPKAPGPPELPDGPLAEPLGLAVPAAIAAVLLAVAATALLAARARRRARATSPPPPPPPPSPDPTAAQRALAAVATLRAASAADAEARRGDVEAAARAVRAYVASRWRVPAPRRTTEEVLAAATARTDGEPALLRAVLGPADLVKFAGDVPSADARDRVLADAEAFVRATSRGAGAAR